MQTFYQAPKDLGQLEQSTRPKKKSVPSLAYVVKLDNISKEISMTGVTLN